MDRIWTFWPQWDSRRAPPSARTIEFAFLSSIPLDRPAPDQWVPNATKHSVQQTHSLCNSPTQTLPYIHCGSCGRRTLAPYTVVASCDPLKGSPLARVGGRGLSTVRTEAAVRRLLARLEAVVALEDAYGRGCGGCLSRRLCWEEEMKVVVVVHAQINSLTLAPVHSRLPWSIYPGSRLKYSAYWKYTAPKTNTNSL